jgi:glycogen debranching enzyme
MLTAYNADQKTNPFNIYKQILADGSISFSAGFPHYPRNFSRDTIKAGIIASNIELLVSQLEISARHQGTRYDPFTGERPGRIHHEYPGVCLKDKDKYSTYNACDTTALFLIAIEMLHYLNKDCAQSFITKRKDNIVRAVNHILANIEDDLFWEYAPKDNENYALQVTYWKDSILPHKKGKTQPDYPIVFSQVHFIAARSLLSASKILNNPSLAKQADQMFKVGINEFIKQNGYIIYRDKTEELVQISSDELHSLAYIPRSYSNLLPLENIKGRSKDLKTPFGFMCTPPDIARVLADQYHGDKVWIFEQAMIHYGTTKFGLYEEALVASSVTSHIGKGQELLAVGHDKNGNIIPLAEGNDRQLWSVAAKQYFKGQSAILNANRL